MTPTEKDVTGDEALYGKISASDNDGGDATSLSSTSARTGSLPLPETTMAELRVIAARYPQPRSALLPMLHLVQASQGCVTPSGIEACAQILGTSAAEVAGVATFYTMYKRRPIGDYHVGVCTNTLCAVMGGDLIFERLKEHLDVGTDETTDDGVVTLEHIECNAACDYAPVMMVNWEFFDQQTPESATRLVDELRSGQEVRATRGARVVTWREAERVLAGFPDGRADEGPAAGAPSLVGLAIARERGWSAPERRSSRGGESSARSESASSSAVDADERTPTRRAESEAKVEEASEPGTSGTPKEADK
jgi:NADH-quinone oxidoreductase subunit E